MSGEIALLRFVLTSSGFQVGFGCGVVVTLGMLILRRGTRWGAEPVPFVGVALVAATGVGLQIVDEIPWLLLYGLLALAGAEGVARYLPRLQPARPLLLVPGAWLITAAAGDGPGWVRWFVVVAIVSAGIAAMDFDARDGNSALGPALGAASVLGVFGTIPDTEQVLVMLGAALPLALIGWPWGRAKLGSVGAVCFVGLLCWTAAVGGIGRPASIVGAIACLGAIAWEPLAHTSARLLRERFAIEQTRFSWNPPTVGLVGATHIALVFLCSRIAGLRSSVAAAAAIAGVASVIAFAVLALAAISAGASRESRGRPEEIH